MKKHILLVVLLAAIVPGTVNARKHGHCSGQETYCDTTIKISNPGEIRIIENAEGLKILNADSHFSPIFEQKYSSEVTSVASRSFYSKKGLQFKNEGLGVRLSGDKKKHWSLTTGGLGFGLNGAIGQPAVAGLQMGKSFEVMWLKALAAEYTCGNSSVSFGLGFDWRNYKMSGAPYRMYKMDGRGIGITGYAPGTVPLNSTVKIFSLAVPVLYSIDIPKISTKFSLGPVLDFNTYSSLKTTYINGDGNRTQEFVKKLGQKPVSVDLFCSATWYCAGLYFKYSPVKAMKNYSEINFNPLTVGIIFFM